MIPRLSPTTERARLTALYGGLLSLAGCLLITVIYLMVQDGLDNRIQHAFTHTAPDRPVSTPHPVPGDIVPPERAGNYAQTVAVEAVTATTLSRLLTVCAIAFALYTLLSLFLAWWMAGRVLRPVGIITATARRLSGQNLHQRIDLKAPPGELKDLADTFDEMLDRLERLVTAQQRFAANAAHELRTPLAIQRAAAEIGLADPEPERVRWIRSELLEAADHSEKLIDSLLLLASTDQGLQRREPVALDEITAGATTGLSGQAQQKEISLHLALEPTTITGDPVLLRHLIRNLLANALAYNHPGGHVHISLTDRTLRVSNTGPLIPSHIAPQLFEPFRRLTERTHTPGEGAGLGLAIVASIAHAHHAHATAHANKDGGLTVTIAFP
ncbi:HAMP domain-containing sensor histidine kinase [Streptomyces sp. TRM64462]|uniref:sensor histidine kinase n=1 Tax=Streptomyces sp. TRM64462 TaxID=2741726 RepID=UPI001586558C|nr:ATP-binding protein [Streptomyces sp. TRM64462]